MEQWRRSGEGEGGRKEGSEEKNEERGKGETKRRIKENEK